MSATPVINIVIAQGTDFSEVFVSTEVDGTISQLNGFSGISVVKKHPGATTSTPFYVGIVSALGEVSIGMTSGVTATLKPGRHYYDVYLTSPTNTISRLVEGQVEVTSGIST